MRTVKSLLKEWHRREKPGNEFLAENECLPDGSPADSKDPLVVVEHCQQLEFERRMVPTGLPRLILKGS